MQRKPVRVSEVRRGFHHDGDVGSAKDVKSELIRPHAKIGVTGLRVRIPELGWTTAIRRPPTRVTGQIIDRCFSVAREQKTIVARGLSVEKDSCQVYAEIKGRSPKTNDAAWNRHIVKTDTAGERRVSDVGNAVGDCDITQVGATGERGDSEAGDATGNGEAFQVGARLEGPPTRYW